MAGAARPHGYLASPTRPSHRMMARERYWWHGSKEDHQRIVESAGAAVAGNGAVERGPPALGQCRHHPRVLNAGAATGVLAATTADAATGAGVLPSSAAGTAIRGNCTRVLYRLDRAPSF